MNRRGIQLLLLLAVLLSFSNCKKKPSSLNLVYDKKYIEEIKKTRNDIVFYASRNNIPGLSVAVAKDGKIVYSEGVGLASKDLEVPVTRETKFRIGQISELFTSHMYLKMIEEGIFHPDSSIYHYIPDFPRKEVDIKLSHLINHTSGIREAYNNEKNWRGLNVTIGAGLDKFKNDSIISHPGYYQNESMFNYNLMGYIMEKTTNTRFKTLLKEYITDTLKLTNTTIDNPMIPIKGRTNYFDHDLVARVVSATFYDMRYRAPSQGMLSNADDLVKFGNSILYSDYLSEETKEKMFEPVDLLNGIPSDMANGWIRVHDSKGYEIYGRKGEVIGGSASLILYPKYGLVIACVTNLKTGVEDTPVFKIAEHFTEKLKESEQAEQPDQGNEQE